MDLKTRLDLTIERKERQGRKANRYFFVAFAAFAFQL